MSPLRQIKMPPYPASKTLYTVPMVYLKPNEQKRFLIIEATISMQITNRQAAILLGVSIRHVKRLKLAVRMKGRLAMIHGLRNKPTNHHKKLPLI